MFPAVINLANLNGQNGFSISGIAASGEFGSSVSSAGDVNGDGITDLIVGADGVASNQGASYVVFGKRTLGSSSTFNLNTLNGQNGFSIPGIVANGFFGFSVSSAGDVNGDGLADLIVGAYGVGASLQGASYVLFGNRTIGSSGTFNLNTINGQNGFSIPGIAASGELGVSVSTAGDVNGDGLADLIVGASNVASPQGASYVLFGNHTLGSSGTFNLATLNGQNGFSIPGIAANGGLGASVSTAGDVNGDGVTDLIVGAPGVASYPGASYVLFGNRTLGGNSGTFNLNTLNGQNGFSIPGIAASGQLGSSVSSAGDVNGDGLADLIVGALDVASNQGACYVLFGNRILGSGGTFNLNALNGQNGFSIPGIAASGYLGQSVSSAGDVNGDGLADLIVGANGVASNQGASYVVFGNRTVGNSGTFNLNTLNGQNGFSIPGVAANGGLGVSVSTAGDVNGDAVTDLIVGAPYEGISNQGASYVVFGKATVSLTSSPSIQPTLLPTKLPTVSPSPLPTLTPSFIPTIFPTDSPSTSPTSMPTAAPTFLPSASPTMASVTSTPSFIPTTSPTFIPTSVPSTIPTAAPTLNPEPTILHNQLTLSNGQRILLSASNLQAQEPGFNANNLIFILSNVQNGYFTLLNPGLNTTTFLQNQITTANVQFTHLGNNEAPSYTVIASDGTDSSLPSLAIIDFQGAPIVQSNTLNTTQSAVTTLTPTSLNITVTDGSNPNQIIIQVLNLQHATLTSTQTGLPVSNFTLANLQANTIQLTQDGSQSAPTYTIQVSGQSGASSAPSTAETQFSSQGIYAPRLMQNYLAVTQAQSTILTPQNLLAVQNNGQGVLNDALFYVTQVSHGQFSLVNNPGTLISFFSQGQLQNRTVQFTQDGSRTVPGFETAVQEFGLQSPSLQAGIFFRVVNQPPVVLQNIPDQTAVVGQPFSFAIPTNTFSDPEGEVITLSAKLFNSTQGLPPVLSFDPANHRFLGTFQALGFYDIGVVAHDAGGLTTETDFTLTVQPAPPIKASYNSAIIGGAISGAMGFGFFGVKLLLQCLAERKLRQGKDEYDRNVVSPIAEAIAKRVKVTGCIGNLSGSAVEDLKSAVRSVITELDQRGVNVRIDQMDLVQRGTLIDEIATQTKKHLVGKRGCCGNIASFFKAEITPEDLREKAFAIAQGVVNAFEEQGLPLSPMSSKKISVTDSADEIEQNVRALTR